MQKIICILVGVFLLNACGYRVYQDEVSIPLRNGDVLNKPKIFIPVFDNVTAFTGAEIPLTRSVRNQLHSQRGVDVVDSREEANLILLGKITGFNRKRDEASTFEGNDQSEEAGGIAAKQLVAAAITVDVAIDLTLIYPDSKIEADRMLWTRNYARSVTYRSSERLSVSEASTAIPMINRSREKISLHGLSDQIAKEIVDQVKQDF